MKRPVYPHLLSKDIPVWERFLAAQGDTYTHFDYDVRVGTGRDPGPDYQQNIRSMALDLSQRRIDAVGFRPNRIDIIEITTAAGLRALGQLTAYPTLYKLSYPDTRPIHPLLVAEQMETDIAEAFAAAKIPVLLYPPPTIS